MKSPLPTELFPWMPALGLALAAASAVGAPPPAASAASAVPVTREELAQRARNEGALGVMAQFCGLPKGEVQALATKSRTDTLALAKNLSVRFDAAAYRAHAALGSEDAREYTGRLPASGRSRDKHCEQVKDKVARKLMP